MNIMRRSDGVSGREAERDYEYLRRMERLIISVPLNRRSDSRRHSREISYMQEGECPTLAALL
jgi:hypothetical protein